jgi:hypothetical protein
MRLDVIPQSSPQVMRRPMARKLEFRPLPPPLEFARDEGFVVPRSDVAEHLSRLPYAKWLTS